MQSTACLQGWRNARLQGNVSIDDITRIQMIEKAHKSERLTLAKVHFRNMQVHLDKRWLSRKPALTNVPILA